MPDALYLQIFSGAVLGLSAGLAPGPLLALVITQTFTHGRAEGIKIALCPLLTDPPIIILSALAFLGLASFQPGIAAISFVGAGYLSYIGYQTMRVPGLRLDLVPVKPKSFQKGMLANLFNPHPYLFWLSVGLPMFCGPRGEFSFAAFIFIFTFYVFLVSSKVALAVLLSKWRTFVQNYIYFWIMKSLGIALFCFALLFIHKGITLLG
jgi:threonine/homoserine/homoserine lactone efflux protein